MAGGHANSSFATPSPVMHDSADDSSLYNENYENPVVLAPGVIVPKCVGSKLRPHQREGVKFVFDCVAGRKPFDGNGALLADDMGVSV